MTNFKEYFYKKLNESENINGYEIIEYQGKYIARFKIGKQKYRIPWNGGTTAYKNLVELLKKIKPEDAVTNKELDPIKEN